MPALPTPATVRHYRTALYSLWTALDGKDAPNPLRDVKPARSDDPEPRALPYEIIDGILAAMPERGQGLRNVPRSDVSKTKARLKVQAYVGLPPKQVMLLREDDVNWRESSVLVQGRHKGKGTHTTRLPLVPQAVAALREFFDAKAEGRFSTSSARQSFRRQIARAHSIRRDHEVFDQLLGAICFLGSQVGECVLFEHSPRLDGFEA